LSIEMETLFIRIEEIATIVFIVDEGIDSIMVGKIHIDKNF